MASGFDYAAPGIAQGMGQAVKALFNGENVRQMAQLQSGLMGAQAADATVKANVRGAPSTTVRAAAPAEYGA